MDGGGGGDGGEKLKSKPKINKMMGFGNTGGMDERNTEVIRYHLATTTQPNPS